MTFPIYETLQPQYTPTQPLGYRQFDDRIPTNTFKLEVVSDAEPRIDIKKRAETQKIPLVLKPVPAAPEKKIVITTNEFQTSVKKGWTAIRPVIGMYAYGAFATMECSDKKVPYKVMEYMEMKGMAELKRSGFDMRRVFLTNVITQRRKRTKKIRIHAKGKMGRVYRDYCTFRLEFTEKPLSEFYKQLIEGKTPPALSYMLGEQLRRRQADYATVRKLQPLLHAKGRSNARINFRRRCWAEWVRLKQEGKSLDVKIIWEKRLEEEAADFEARYGDMFNDVARKREERLTARKEVFARNQANG